MGNHLKSQEREGHDLVYDLKESAGKEMKHPKGRIELEKTSKSLLKLPNWDLMTVIMAVEMKRSEQILIQPSFWWCIEWTVKKGDT